MPTENLALGRNRTLGFCIEGTADVYTPADYNQVWGEPTMKGIGFLEATPGPNKELMIEPHMSGRPEMTNQDIVEGINNSTFTLKMKCPKENLAWFILGFFGKITTTGTESPYTHTSIPSLTPGWPPSFKLEYREPLNTTDTRLQFRGNKVKSILFEFIQNSTVMVTIEFTGGSWAKDAALGIAPTILIPASGNPFWTFADIKGTTFLQLGGTTLNGFNSIILKFENMLAEDIDDSYELGSAERIRLERSADRECIKLTGTFKRLLKDNNPFQWWNDLSTIFFQTDLSTTSPIAYGLTLNGYTKLLTRPIRTARGLGLIEETIEIQSIYSIPESTSIQCIISDTQATPATQGA